jgi:hypothetical protein
VLQGHVWLQGNFLMLSGYLLISRLFKFIAFDQAPAGVMAAALGWESLVFRSLG